MIISGNKGVNLDTVKVLVSFSLTVVFVICRATKVLFCGGHTQRAFAEQSPSQAQFEFTRYFCSFFHSGVCFVSSLRLRFYLIIKLPKVTKQTRDTGHRTRIPFILLLDFFLFLNFYQLTFISFLSLSILFNLIYHTFY